MIISLIASLTVNLVIGRENTIPWHFPIDLNWFKYHTFNKPIIMGRKTFESIGSKPLLGRFNIILSHRFLNNIEFNNVIIVDNPVTALLKAKEKKAAEVMIIGGSSVYNIFLNQSTRMYLTYIDVIYLYGDTWFPNYIKKEWTSIFNFCRFYQDYKKNYYSVTFKILERF